MNYEKPKFAPALILFGLLLTTGVQARAFDQRPNVVFLLVDDLGWADVGCYGSRFYETPNIDRLAARGMRFTQAYAAGSVCSPTRASIMTGRHPVRVDITDWIPGQNADRQPDAIFRHIDDRDSLALEETTIAELLRDADYQTYFVGKWHLGDAGALPTDQGFDVNIGGYIKGSPPGGYYAPFKNPYLPDAPTPPEGDQTEYLTERLTSESSQLIRNRDRSKPFFLNLCYYNVHTPIQPYRPRVEHFREKANEFSQPTPVADERDGKTRLRQDNPEYASMVAAVDASVGSLMEVLEDEAILENTIIVFFSDNGGLSTVRRPGPTSNLPLRAGKGWLYEGGIREPLIVVAPNHTRPGSVCDTPVISMDFFPTLAELTGVAAPSDLVLDGQTFAHLLGGDTLSRPAPQSPPRSLVWHYPHYHGSTWTPGAAIRQGDWKLIEFYHWHEFELYDLAVDPGETNNLAASHPQVAERLRRELSDWQREMGAKMPAPRD
jgi:arylsulfatase A-like enzyme